MSRRSLLGKLLNRAGDTSTPVPFVSAGPGHFVFGNNGAGTDPEAYMRTYGTSGTVFAIVSLLARSTAAPEWKLFRKQPADGRVRYTTGDRGTDQRVEVVKHAALDLWHRPNPFMTGHVFREAGIQHLELTGETSWVLDRENPLHIPLSMWPVRPDRLAPVPDPETFLKGYIYTAPNGEKVPLNVDEVVQTKYPNPLDPYRGLGPIQSILTDIDAMKYGAEWNRNFFINSATPGGIIEVDDQLTDDEWNELSSRWREAHQGVSRAHRVALLDGGAKWVERSYSMKDMQFTELRDVSRDVIREAFRIHKSMLGNSSEVNRANAQTAEEVFGRWHVVERLNRLRSTVNHQLLPMFYPDGAEIPVELDYVNPLPDDREADNSELTAKATAAQLLVEAGFDRGDVCEVVGLPAMRAAETVTPPEAPAAPNGQPSNALGTLRATWHGYDIHSPVNGHQHDRAGV